MRTGSLVLSVFYLGTDYDADDEGGGYSQKSDTQLMPPPPIPTGKTSESEKSSDASEPKKKKLDTPLAAMLPSKYANVDVTELFPDFRSDKVAY